MTRLGLPDLEVLKPVQNSCSICLKYEDQCKDKKLLDITEIGDEDKSCLDKIQELMHVEIVLGYQTVCITCATEINEAYLLQGKIIDAITFWKEYFGYEESSELNVATDVKANDTSTEKLGCDISINTIPKREKIVVKEEIDDDTLMSESYQDFVSDNKNCSKDSNFDETLPESKVKKSDPDAKLQLKSEDLTVETVTVVPEASIKKITKATITNSSAITKGEKEDNDTKKKTLFCGQCNYYYADISEIVAHFCIKRKPTRTEPKPIDCYGCAACGKIFKRKIDLNRHQKDQHAVQPYLNCYSCEACGKRFKSKIDLNLHKQDQHPVVKTNIECYGCAACGKVFKRKIDLNRHQKDEHPFVKPTLVCNICDKSCRNEAHLRAHYSIHTGEHNYCCDVCGQTFKWLSSVSRHLRQHTSGERRRERPFLCAICGKLFPHSNTMSRHMMWHAGVKRFKCAICDKKFNRRQHLRAHLRSHTGERPYACEFCCQAFTEKASKRKHVFSKHKEMFQDEII